MDKQGIIRRWVINNLVVVLLVLVIIDLSLIMAIQGYYYGSAKQYMSSKLSSVHSILYRYSEDSNKNFSSEVRSVIEGFSEKDKMELMAINSKGEVTLTSSGFSPEGEEIVMPDYEQIINEDSQMGYYVGRQRDSEKIMAVTSSISSMSSDYSAIRVVVSLSEVDNQIFYTILIVTGICLLVLLLVAFSGLYFVKSIVKPVREITDISQCIARGDFSRRIIKKNNDEIGDLCDVINYMANELSNTESVKNDFISSVSHELRTPLTAIKGWAETIVIGNDTDTTKKGLGVIIKETERLSLMVEELLDFSRIQNGKFTLNNSVMDILAEIEEAVLIYTEKAKGMGIEVVYTAPDMLPFVYGDRNRLRQVFINIIDNAIKYSDNGGVVRVEAAGDNGQICIVVADNGCGISEEDLPRIRTKFYKANHTRRGSGIGLAVADEIIKMHNGSVEIESKLGEGTTVIIYLPTHEDREFFIG